MLRDYDGSAPNLSECCVPFYLRSILNADLGESLVRGVPGVGFSCEISRNVADRIFTFERFLL